jgi:hypothetical protein
MKKPPSPILKFPLPTLVAMSAIHMPKNVSLKIKQEIKDDIYRTMYRLRSRIEKRGRKFGTIFGVKTIRSKKDLK